MLFLGRRANSFRHLPLSSQLLGLITITQLHRLVFAFLPRTRNSLWIFFLSSFLNLPRLSTCIFSLWLLFHYCSRVLSLSLALFPGISIIIRLDLCVRPLCLSLALESFSSLFPFSLHDVNISCVFSTSLIPFCTLTVLFTA